MSSRSEKRDRADEAAEAYRRLRSTVKFAEGDRPIRSVLVVDIDRPQQSDVAHRLSEAFARAGDDCVYVDANVRQTPGDGSTGFTDLIACRESIADVVRSGGEGACSIVGPGSIQDPDLLAGSGLHRAVQSLLDHHEYVILSSASLPEYGDAIALAPQLDAVILTVTKGTSRRPRAVAARDSLHRVGARLLGIIMVEPPGRRFL